MGLWKDKKRRDWRYSFMHRGKVYTASAFLYSLIETAKANGLKPYFYLRYLFDRLPSASTEEDYLRLLSPFVDKADLKRADA